EAPMTASTFACYQLPVAAVGALVSQPVDVLKPHFTSETDVTPYTAYDCFDHSLRRSGRLLLASPTTLELFDINGRTLSQPSRHTIGLISDLTTGPIKKALSDLSPLRRLLPLGSGQ